MAIPLTAFSVAEAPAGYEVSVTLAAELVGFPKAS